jgi:hypothetical protein
MRYGVISDVAGEYLRDRDWQVFLDGVIEPLFHEGEVGSLFFAKETKLYEMKDNMIWKSTS